MLARVIAALGALGVTCAAATCTPAPDVSACYPGDYGACACGDEAGYRRCGDDGAFGACDCSRTPGSDAGAPAGAGGSGGAAVAGSGGAGGGALLPFMSPCTDDEQCETKLCFAFVAKGPHCTIPCTPTTVCPPPSDACNGMGVCKAP
jgi:hypothetical protein